jgi:intracellular septation protein A
MDASSVNASSARTSSAQAPSAQAVSAQAPSAQAAAAERLAPEPPAPQSPAARGGGARAVARIVIVDIAVPLALYSGLTSAGLSPVTALVLSGVFPALSVIIGAVRRRRLEVVGALVLAGIVLGAVLGLAFRSARLVLVEGSVPTAVFGVACLGSLILGKRPLMYGFAREFIGPDSARGREMARLWQYGGFRQVWRVITAAWGVAFLIEAALRVVIIYSASVAAAAT